MGARRVWALLAALAAVAGGCSSPESTAPEQRAVVVSTQACGHASKTMGSGVAVGPSQVVTAAHVVVGASEVEVEFAGVTHLATVAALDTGRDVAILAVPGLDVSTVEFVQLDRGESATIVEGASSGSVEADVIRRVSMTVDEVRGSGRTSRGGYELAATIDGGDSGAGLFDRQGRLAALVFAAPTQRQGIAWATRSEEIKAVLTGGAGSFTCDPALSRLVPS